MLQHKLVLAELGWNQNNFCLNITHLVCAKIYFSTSIIQMMSSSFSSLLLLLVFCCFLLECLIHHHQNILLFITALLTDRASQDQCSGFQILISRCALGFFSPLFFMDVDPHCSKENNLLWTSSYFLSICFLVAEHSIHLVNCGGQLKQPIDVKLPLHFFIVKLLSFHKYFP